MSECVCVCVQVDIASGVVVVEQCDLSGESDAVVRIHNAGTQAVLRGNLIHDSTGAGVVVAASAAPTLVDNDIRAHQLDGLSLISLSLSLFLSLSFFLSLSLFLSQTHKQTGLVISTGGCPTVQGNRIADCKTTGVLVSLSIPLPLSLYVLHVCRQFMYI